MSEDSGKVNCEILRVDGRSWLSASGVIEMLKTPEANKLSASDVADSIHEAIFRFELDSLNQQDDKPAPTKTEFVAAPRRIVDRLWICKQILLGRNLSLK